VAKTITMTEAFCCWFFVVRTSASDCLEDPPKWPVMCRAGLYTLRTHSEVRYELFLNIVCVVAFTRTFQ